MTIEARAVQAAERLRAEVAEAGIPDVRSVHTRARRRRAAATVGVVALVALGTLWLADDDKAQDLRAGAPSSSVPQTSTSPTDGTSTLLPADEPPVSIPSWLPSWLGHVGKLTFPENISPLDADLSLVARPDGQFVEVRLHEAPPEGHEYLTLIVDGLAAGVTRRSAFTPGEVWGSRVRATVFGREIEVQVVATTEDGTVLAATPPVHLLD